MSKSSSLISEDESETVIDTHCPDDFGCNNAAGIISVHSTPQVSGINYWIIGELRSLPRSFDKIILIRNGTHKCSITDYDWGLVIGIKLCMHKRRHAYTVLEELTNLAMYVCIIHHRPSFYSFGLLYDLHLLNEAVNCYNLQRWIMHFNANEIMIVPTHGSTVCSTLYFRVGKTLAILVAVKMILTPTWSWHLWSIINLVSAYIYRRPSVIRYKHKNKSNLLSLGFALECVHFIS